MESEEWRVESEERQFVIVIENGPRISRREIAAKDAKNDLTERGFSNPLFWEMGDRNVPPPLQICALCG